MSDHLSRRDFCATAIGSILASTVSVRAAEKKYDPGASDSEIKLGQTVPHHLRADGFEGAVKDGVAHLPFPGIGPVAQAGTGYAFVPIAWNAAL